MLFRIGINLGDVIVRRRRHLLATASTLPRGSRRRPLPGALSISNTVYDQVRNKVAVGFDFLGPLTVKNVAEARAELCRADRRRP